MAKNRITAGGPRPILPKGVLERLLELVGDRQETWRANGVLPADGPTRRARADQQFSRLLARQGANHSPLREPHPTEAPGQIERKGRGPGLSVPRTVRHLPPLTLLSTAIA